MFCGIFALHLVDCDSKSVGGKYSSPIDPFSGDIFQRSHCASKLNPERRISSTSRWWFKQFSCSTLCGDDPNWQTCFKCLTFFQMVWIFGNVKFMSLFPFRGLFVHPGRLTAGSPTASTPNVERNMIWTKPPWGHGTHRNLQGCTFGFF